MTTATEASSLPLSRIKSSDAINARREADTDLEQLAASIAAKGLIQPLVVRPASKGDAFEIIDGRRRFRALQRLAKARTITKDHAVPVVIRAEDDSEALETSLMANMVRLPMHPVDQHEVFARLESEGLEPADIASRFGIPERRVRQHLALGRLAPEIRTAWRAGEIEADAAQAFTIIEDPVRQASLFNELSNRNRGHVSRWQVTKEITGEKPRTDCDEARFVGLDAYEAAGGTITRSLFDEAGYIDDEALLYDLEAQKLDAACAQLQADGWAWAKRTDEVKDRYRYEQQRVKAQPTEAEAARIDALKSTLDADDEIEDFDTRMPDEARETIENELADLKQAADLRAYTPAQRKRLGCFVRIDGGRLAIDAGFRLPKQKQVDIEDAIDEAADGARDPAHEAPAETAGMSAALVQTLTEIQTVAAKRALAKDSVLALRVLLTTLRVKSAFGAHGPMRVGTQGMAQQRESDSDDTFAGLLPTSAGASLVALAGELAPLLADALDLRTYHASADREDERSLVWSMRSPDYLEAARDLFDPADFFARAPKDIGLAAIEEMREAGVRPGGHVAPTVDLGRAKKAAIALAAADMAKQCGWLPEILRHPDYRISSDPPKLRGQMAAAEQTDDGDAAEVAAPKRARRAG